MIPFGLRSKVNLARDVNDVTFVNEVQAALNEGNSRLLDVTYYQTKAKVKHWDSKVNKCLDSVKLSERWVGPLPQGWRRCSVWYARREAKRTSIYDVIRKQNTMIRKLYFLRLEKQQGKEFQISGGSQKMSGDCYKQKQDKVRGAPFPTNLRLHRRHRRKPDLTKTLTRGLHQPKRSSSLGTL